MKESGELLIKKEKNRRKGEMDEIQGCSLKIGNKLDLALLLLARKKVAYLGSYKVVEGEKEKQEIIEEFSQELKEIKRVCDSLSLFHDTQGLKIEDEIVVGFSIFISKRKEDLAKFIEAVRREDDRTMGLMLGYPETAVDAYNSERSLDSEIFFGTKLAQKQIREIGCEEAIKFLGFQPSKKYWKEELIQVKEIQRLIEENAPRLYWEIMNEKRKQGLSRIRYIFNIFSKNTGK